MRSRCFIWFPISDLGEPYIYHDSGVDYKEVGRLWWEFVRVINIYTSQVIIIVDGVSTDHPL